MPVARIIVDPAYTVGPLNRRLFGSFVEHLGRCVYDGIYEPGHPSADADGFRTDVMELVRELGVTTIRKALKLTGTSFSLDTAANRRFHSADDLENSARRRRGLPRAMRHPGTSLFSLRSGNSL